MLNAKFGRWCRTFTLFLACGLMVGCRPSVPSVPAPSSPEPSSASSSPKDRWSSASPSSKANRPSNPLSPSPTRTILVMGDSLSAAYGLKTQDGWVGLLSERLKHTHPHWRVVNASISGETTSGGAARMSRALKTHTPAIVILELGANDGLRGLGVDQTQKNLDQMILESQQSHAQVLVLGMKMPPNLGQEYAQSFEKIYPKLSQQHRTDLVDFFLEPIASDRRWFQNDNLHPTKEAQPLLLDHVWQTLEPMLDKEKSPSTPALKTGFSEKEI